MLAKLMREAKDKAPGFKRYLVTRDEDSVLVDTVWERVKAPVPAGLSEITKGEPSISGRLSPCSSPR